MEEREWDAWGNAHQSRLFQKKYIDKKISYENVETAPDVAVGE